MNAALICCGLAGPAAKPWAAGRGASGLARRSLLAVGIAAMPALAHATIATTFETSGTAAVLAGTPQEQVATGAGDYFFEVVTTGGAVPASAALTFGEIAQDAAGIEFQNAVGGYGGGSSGTSTTLIRQTFTNDTASVRQVNFSGFIYGGVIGLWAPDLAGCAPEALLQCPAVNSDGLPPAPSVFGGPAEASLSILLTADGIPVIDLDLFVGVGLPSDTGDNITLSFGGADSFLNGFAQVGGPGDGSLLFAWNDTTIDPVLGLVNPGETIEFVYTVTASFLTFGDCAGSIAQCVAAVSCYGDPIGGGGDSGIISRALHSGASFRGAAMSAAAPTCAIAVRDVDVPAPAPIGLLGLAVSLLGIVQTRRAKRR